MVYFQFRLKMRFPWRIHFKGSKMSILLNLSTNILTGFFLMLQHFSPGTRGWEWGQGPGYFRTVCEEPDPISLTHHWVLEPGCFPWNSELLGKLSQSLRGFPGRTNISPWQRSSSSLLLPLNCLRGWKNRPANRSPGVTAVWGNLWPIVLEPTGNAIYAGKKINTPKDSFKDVWGKVAKVQHFV